MATKGKTFAADEVVKEKECGPLMDATRKVLLAGIGAVALAQDEVEDFVNKLVERGEIAEKDGNLLVREVLEKRRKTIREVEDEMGKRVQGVLDRMNVPTKADIEALSEKITALSRKIDELKKDRGINP